jgi:O-antigen ligase
MGVSLVMTLSRSGIAGFGIAIALATIAAVRRQETARARLSVALALAVLVVAPVLWANSNVGERFSTQGKSLALRRGIWSDTRRVIDDFPLAGTGLNTFAAAMEVYQTGFSRQNVREAHNDYLQLMAEGGVLVGIPIAATILLFAAAIRHRFTSAEDDPKTSWLRVGAATGIAAIALQSAVEFSLQMPGNAVCFVVLAAVALHKPRGQESSNAIRSVPVAVASQAGARFLPAQ